MKRWAELSGKLNYKFRFLFERKISLLHWKLFFLDKYFSLSKNNDFIFLISLIIKIFSIFLIFQFVRNEKNLYLNIKPNETFFSGITTRGVFQPRWMDRDQFTSLWMFQKLVILWKLTVMVFKKRIILINTRNRLRKK